jgi:hypothetical protein
MIVKIVFNWQPKLKSNFTKNCLVRSWLGAD